MSQDEVGTSVPALPENGVLLHIGPYKTGSTALQQALFDQRDELAERDIFYPRAWRRLLEPGHSVMRWAPRGRIIPDESVWERFSTKVRGLPGRVCISTEDFGKIQDTAISGKIVTDLGADRVHVVAVARPYHRLLPSHWQERMKSRDPKTFEKFLAGVLDDDKADRHFHASHDIEGMLSRWLPFVPPERFTVIIGDDTDRALVPRTFEQMLGLPAGFLRVAPGANQSLSAEGAELLRQVNLLSQQSRWTDVEYSFMVQRGAALGLQEVPRAPEEHAIPPVPAWAVPMLTQRSQERIDALVSSGVRVVGDQQLLMPPADLATSATIELPRTISIESAAAALDAAVLATRKRTEEEAILAARAAKQAKPDPGQAKVAEAPARDLAVELARRVRRRLPGSGG